MGHGMEQAIGLSKEILPEQEFFQTLFENSSTGAALADVEGHFLSTNRSLQKMLDRSDEEFRRMLLQDLTTTKRLLAPSPCGTYWRTNQVVSRSKRGACGGTARWYS
jgi:PAS domain-containing protein